MNLLLDLEEFVDSAFDEFCANIDDRIVTSGTSRATIDLGTMLQFLAMDVAGELAFGQSFGSSGSAPDDRPAADKTQHWSRFEQGRDGHGRLSPNA